MRPAIINDDDSETELPFKWEICSHCDGHGKSSAHLGAFTREDMDEQGPEFLEDYLDGVYDKPCEHCEGGKVRVVDRARCTKAQIKAWNEQCRDLAEMRAIERAERRFEGGWRDE